MKSHDGKHDRSDDSKAHHAADRRAKSRNGRRSSDAPSKGRLAFLISGSVGAIVIALLALRASVQLIGGEPSLTDGTFKVRPVSRERNRSDSDRRRLEHEAIRENALKVDRELLEERDYRLWQERTRPRPGKMEARTVWQREVDDIQKQIDEVMPLQEKLGEEGPLAEGTILWHRKQHLEQLLADPPAPTH